MRIMISKLIKDSPPDFVWIKKILDMFGDPRNEDDDRAAIIKLGSHVQR